MTQQIRIQNQPDGTQRVSAREMYQNLGLDATHWKRWANKNIEKNPFANEGLDWVGFAIMANGNQTKEYALTIDFAKKLCMLTRTEAGENIRNYFVEVERVAINHHAHQLPAARKMVGMADYNRRIEAQRANLDISEFTAFGYSRYIKKPICGNEATAIGKQASKLCREQGLPIGQTKSVQWGMVNTYPENVLYAVFSDFFKKPRF